MATGLYEWHIGYEWLFDALFSPRSPRFRTDVGAQVRPLVVQGQYWRVVTGMFLHADLVHLGVNGLSVLALGRILEPWVGSVRFLLCFLLGGFAGAVASHLVGMRLTDGASGGAFALLGAVLVLSWERRPGMHPDDQRAFGPYLWGFAALNVALSFVVPFFNAAAHLGGLGFGVVFAAVVTRTHRTPTATTGGRA